eukprot:scaffold8528_cov36-Prasinocladus_malaysianus.AAC.3
MQPHHSSGAPLQWMTDLVTAQVLVKALKEANPNLLVLDISDSDGSKSTLTTVSSLGVGAYGYVEKCRLQLAGDNFEQLVAVKRFHNTHRPNIHELNHFLKEASVLGSLQHRHIVRLIGIGTVDGTIQGLYTAQELVDGPNLMELVESEVVNTGPPRYAKEHALRWCLQVAEALRYLHIEHDLVHRDIKLSNLVLTSSNPEHADVKLLDWGLASKVPEPVLADRPCKANKNVACRASSADRMNILSNHAKSSVRQSLSTGSLDRPELSTPTGPRSSSRLSRSSRDNPSPSTSRAASKLGSFGSIANGTNIGWTAAKGPSRLDVKTIRSPNGCQGGSSLLLMDPGCLMNTGSTGTPIYAAPECRLSNMFDQKADVYSFGVMAYELFNCTTVLREAAIAGHTAATGATAMSTGHWRPKFREQCPAEVREVLVRCWDPDPAARPTADEIVAILSAVQDRLVCKPCHGSVHPGHNKSKPGSRRASDAGGAKHSGGPKTDSGSLNNANNKKRSPLSQLFSCFNRPATAMLM